MNISDLAGPFSVSRPTIRDYVTLLQRVFLLEEVKASATVTAADFRGLRKLKDATGRRFVCGVVLYDGETTASFGDGMFAVPVRSLWEA